MIVTIQDVVNDVITELAQIPGTTTQIYAVPIIQKYVQNAIIMAMDEFWWPDLMCFIPNVTPDGTTGLLTTDLVGPISSIKRFQDIRGIYPMTSNRRLRRLPTNTNPYTLTGSANYYVSPDATYANRPFRVWPVTSTDALVVDAKQYPTIPISLTDTFLMDRLYICWVACWLYATADGTNPSDSDKFAQLVEKRLTQVKAMWNNLPTSLDSRYTDSQDLWLEVN